MIHMKQTSKVSRWLKSRLSWQWSIRLTLNEKWRWPLMWKATHEMQEIGFSSEIRRIRRETDKLKEDLSRTVPKLVNVALCIDHSQHMYRVVVDFTPHAIASALTWGNDTRMLEEIADQVRYQVLRELTTANLHRFSEYEKMTPTWGWKR